MEDMEDSENLEFSVINNPSYSSIFSTNILGKYNKDDGRMIFTEKDLLVLNNFNKNEKGEPNWKYMFFDWMTDTIKELFFKYMNKIYNQANLFFIKGLLCEYDDENQCRKILKKTTAAAPISNSKIINCEKNDKYSKALDYYLLGSKLNNQYCLFKLFYIFIDDENCSKFGVKKNVDLGIFYLIKASSYNESFLDINKIDPIIKLMHIIYYHDRDLSRIRKLLEKMKNINNEMNFLIDDLEDKYLFNFLKLNFCKHDYEFDEALLNLEKISELHPEACYKIACFYYNPFLKQICARNVTKSIEMFKTLFQKNYTKSYCSYYKICEEQKLEDRIENVLLVCKKSKNYASQFYANFLTRKKDEIIINSDKILKYFFKSLLYGNLISIVICFEIISQIIFKKVTEIKGASIGKYEKYVKIIFDFVTNRKYDKNLIKLLEYDIIVLFHQIHAYFYYKGILVKKNINKAIEILESTFIDKKSFKNYRKIFYYLGKAYRKLGNIQKSNFYLKFTFQIYLMIKEFPYHHYIVGKIFLRGIPEVVEKNIQNAFYFFNLGAKYNENYYFINSFYSYKCITYLKDNNDLSRFNTDNSNIENFSIDKFINEDHICIVCYSNFKQIILIKCGHKCLCYLCFEKIYKNDENRFKTSLLKCPMCQQESNSYLNSFETDLDFNKFNQ